MRCFYWLESSKWCILKSCYTGGCLLQRFWHYFTDGLNQSLISSVGQTWIFTSPLRGSVNIHHYSHRLWWIIVIIIDLWSQPPVCSYKFLREASCRLAWVHWSMFSYIKRLKNEVKIKYKVVVTVVWPKWWFNLFNWSLMYFFYWSLYFVNTA